MDIEWKTIARMMITIKLNVLIGQNELGRLGQVVVGAKNWVVGLGIL
jgi:hypothetical protein